MKRAIWCVVATSLLVMIFFPALANAPTKPFALCANGQCVMAEADYRKLQQFHKDARVAFQGMQGHIEEQDAVINRLAGQVAACKSRQAERDL
jgi:hypothetical protein